MDGETFARPNLSGMVKPTHKATWRLAVSNSVTFNTLGKIEALIHFDKVDG
jgi:hypothetical protein